MESQQNIYLKIVKKVILYSWRGYQVVLGLILVALLWGISSLADYLKYWEIQKLAEQNPSTTSFMNAEYERLQMSNSGPEDILYSWIPYEEIPAVLREMVLIAEDAKFYDHVGFDLSEIEYAIVSNHQKGEKARGASTISQQLVKNLYLSSDKKMSRKIREAGITLLLENRLTKRRILELYLNIAQFGPGVFGVSEGAEYQFGKELSRLSTSQLARLVAVIPSPKHWRANSLKGSYKRHFSRILKNYALYKGLKKRVDFDDLDWKKDLFKELNNIIDEGKWGKLKTMPAIDHSTDSSERIENEQPSVYKASSKRRLKRASKSKQMPVTNW
ncbi:MAG: monofunctional biosynthetic peptidoglycan transglycosylase [Fibrobacterales bacterium]